MRTAGYFALLFVLIMWLTYHVLQRVDEFFQLVSK